MGSEPTGRSVLVLDSGTRGGLAAVRELARSGWRVGLGTPRPGTYADRSRAVAARHHVRLPGPVEALVEDVVAAVARGGHDVVLGAGDDWMVALADATDGLPVPVAHPHRTAVAAAVDKLELDRRAAAVGLASPATWLPDQPPPAGAGPPFVVKTRAHGPVDRAGGRPLTAVVTSVGQLDRVVEEFIADGHEPIVQEAVTGRLMALAGVVLDGRLTGRVQQVADATWPLPAGVSCRARTVPVDGHLAGRVEELLVDLGWTGMAEVQFLEPSQGPPRLIDVNGRPYGSLALAGGAGVPLVDATVRATLGLPVAALPDGRTGVHYQWLEGDLRRAWQQRRGGAARDVLTTLARGRTATHSVWDWRDPAPLLRTRVLDPVLERLGRP